MSSQPTSGARTPVAVRRYLLPREHEVATVRQHPVVLLIPATQAVGGLVLGIILTFALPESLPQLTAIWTAVTLLILNCLRTVMRWFVDYLTVTHERIIVAVGFTHRSISQFPLHEMTHLSLVRTFAGRMLGYGALVNGSQLISAFVPYPEQLYLLIIGMLYPQARDDPDNEAVDYLGDEA